MISSLWEVCSVIEVSGTGKLLERLIVETAHDQERNHGSDPTERHVLLCVPDVPLRSEEGIAFGTVCQRNLPLDQLIERAESKADRNNDEGQPLSFL